MEGTCISVARLSPTPDEPDVQVAEFRSTKVSHVEAYAFAGAIIAYYAKYMEQTTRYRHPIITVEQVLRSGDMSQLQLMKSFGFSPSRMHHFTRYDSKDVAKSKRDSRKLGQYSYAWARPILIDTWVTLVMNGWYIVNSPFTLAECDGFEVHYTGTSGKSKFVRSEGSTEDGIYANALAGFCPRDLKALAERTKKRCGAGTRKAVLSMIPPPQGLVVQTTRRIGELYT